MHLDILNKIRGRAMMRETGLRPLAGAWFVPIWIQRGKHHARFHHSVSFNGRFLCAQRVRLGLGRCIQNQV